MINNDKLNQLLKRAKGALRQGDRKTAGALCQQIINQNPDCLEAWLFLAGIAKPEMRTPFLRQAQLIAPTDPRVKKALAWAKSQSVESQKQVQKIASSSALEETQPLSITEIAAQTAEKHRRLAWILPIGAVIVLSLVVISLALLSERINRQRSSDGIFAPINFTKPTLTSSPTLNSPETILTTRDIPIVSPTLSPTPNPTPTVVPNLYGCNIEMSFTSGPLAGEGTSFSMLDETYFYDKGDKFDIGKNTGIFYDQQRYVILHSGYNGGNLRLPLEIEFLRKYLEQWGNGPPEYIKGQVDALLGSELIWRCDGQEIMQTRVKDVVRLSHEASTRLWLEPENIYEILETREDDSGEWIGEIDQMPNETLYLGFCGWGPPEITVDRSIYFRYLIQFAVLE